MQLIYHYRPILLFLGLINSRFSVFDSLMDLDTERFLARARQREEEIEKENCFSTNPLQNDSDGTKTKEGNVQENTVLSVEPEKSETSSIYPVQELRRLSEDEENSVSQDVPLKKTPNEKVVDVVTKISDLKETSKRRSVFSDLAANFENFEVDMKPRAKTPKTKQSSSRLSVGETRPSALFTPNAKYYAPLTVAKLPKQSSGHMEHINGSASVEANRNVSFSSEKVVETTVEQSDENRSPNSKHSSQITCSNVIEENLTSISHAESGDDEKQLNGPLESTTLLNSPSAGHEGSNFKIINFFEKQSDEYTSPCDSREAKHYEPSPIPKVSEKLTTVVLHSGFDKHRDIVDEITFAANNATKALNDLPSGCGRAKEIVLKLEEKAKRESCMTPILVSSTSKKNPGPSSLKKSVQPTTNVHIHYRLNVPTTKCISKVPPIAETTKTNVRSLRNRWEVSSSSGTPLHPDQGEDDLLEAARQMARAVKQSNQWRIRPRSCYESVDTAEMCREVNTSAGSSPSHGGHSSLSLVTKDKLNTTASMKEDEKCKKRLTMPDDDGDADTALSLEKKPKREDSDEAKFSGQLVGEALGAFEFLNETPTRNSSFLSSILDSTSEAQPTTVSTASEKVEEKEYESVDINSDEIPLVHSVSFYRKKKKELHCVGETTVLGQFTTSPPHGSSNSGQRSPLQQMSEGQRFATQKERLEKEMLIQDEQISQASKALRHCRKNLEFRGGRMEVDAQRALLIAKEHRRALQNAYDKLLQTYSYGNRVQEQHKPRGTLTVKDISLRLMRDFVNGHINYHSDQMLYYFIILIRHEETLHHTAMVTSDEGLQSGYISFPNYIQIKSLPHDFTCILEVYALRTKRDLSSQTTTLKKTTRLPSFHQGYSSPGPIAAVIDPSFQKIGTLALNIGNIAKSKFHLTDVLSPLDGIVTMTLSCFPEETGTIGHKGFLSLYQEVEGIASWTRFWCVLNDGNLKFWKYPEDESKKPVVIINLRDSASEEIKPLGAETCPYPHSMTIDIWIESAHRKGKHEKIRIMMAADTKEDMHKWLGVLNGSLRNITLWYPKH